MEDGKIVIDREKCNNCARCVKSCPTDAWVGEPGYIVSFGGLFGNKIYKGEQIVPIIRDKETLFRVTDAAISFFEKHANAGVLTNKMAIRIEKERKSMAEIQFDDQVDITDKVCPLTFVKAKVAIEELDDGEVLAIRMNDGEPVQNVPRSMKEEGHKILKLEDNADGTYTLYVRKVEE